MTREQERARAHRRQQKVAQREAEKAAERARNRQVVGVVVAILVVIGIFIAISSRLGGGEDKTATPAASSAGIPSCQSAPAPATTAKQLTLPDKATAAGKTFTAVLTTNCGPITLELDGTKAPQTVASFVSLSRQAYFDGSPCHRLTLNGLFVLQCGDPTGQGSGGPGYGYGIENAPASGNYPRGSLAMARTTDPKSNGSQFFIVYKDTKLPTAGGGYSIFGTVTGGMDIVEKIAAAGVSGGASDGAPVAPISILKVAVTEKKA